MTILRESHWEFITSAGMGAEFGILGYETGMFVLKDTSGQFHKYLYSGFGIASSRGLSTLLHAPRLALPKIIVKNGQLSGSGSTTGFTSLGKLFLTDAFKNADLTDPKSLEGGTIYLAGAAGYLYGGAMSFMFLGLNRALLVMGVAKPDFIGMAIRSAPAALLMAGDNAGLQDAAGFSYMFGQIDYKGLYDEN